MFPFNHLIDLFEFFLNLFVDQIKLILQGLFVFAHLNINVFDSFQLLIKDTQVVLVVLSDVSY